MASAFYSYNATAFAAIAGWHRYRDQALVRWIVIGVIASVVLQTALAVFSNGGEFFRYSGSFNNPNQLSYFVLSATVIVLIGHGVAHIGGVPVLVAMGGALTLALMSLSRGGIAAMVLLFAITMTTVSRTARTITAYAFVAAGAVAVLLVTTQAGESIRERLQLRAATWPSKVDAIPEERAYNRLIEYPSHLILGAGEGRLERFGGPAVEVHSTFGTIAFSYGIPGTLLFGTFLWFVFRHATVRTVLLAVPLGLYGITHHGLRFTIVWVALAVIYIVSSARFENASPVAPAPGLSQAPRPRAPVLWRSGALSHAGRLRL